MDLTYVAEYLLIRFLLLLFCWGVASSYAYMPPKALPIYPPARGLISKEMVKSVFIEICNQKIAFPQQVMKQAILETGWFRSDFLMSKNNLFGFRKIRY